MAELAQRQSRFVSAASALPEYSGWSEEEIRANVAEVLSSGDASRIQKLSGALSKLPQYGGWQPEEISGNLGEIFPGEEKGESGFVDKASGFIFGLLDKAKRGWEWAQSHGVDLPDPDDDSPAAGTRPTTRFEQERGAPIVSHKAAEHFGRGVPAGIAGSVGGMARGVERYTTAKDIPEGKKQVIQEGIRLATRYGIDESYLREGEGGGKGLDLKKVRERGKEVGHDFSRRELMQIASAVQSQYRKPQKPSALRETVRLTAKQIADQAKEARDIVTPEDPGFAFNLGSGAGSLATFMMPGLAVNKAMALTKAPAVAGMFISSVLEATAEAGSAYEEMKDNGADENAAQGAADKVFGKNLALLLATNKLGGLFEATKPGVWKVLMGAAMEGLQETGQETISMGDVEDVDMEDIAKDIQEKGLESPYAKRLLTAFSVGGLTGGAAGGVQTVAEAATAAKEVAPKAGPTQRTETGLESPEGAQAPETGAPSVAPAAGQEGAAFDGNLDQADQASAADRPTQRIEPPPGAEAKPTRGIDPLYKIQNRAAFDEDMEQAVQSDEPMAVAVLDQVNQGRLNDVFGHEGTDDILRELGAIEDKHIVDLRNKGWDIERYRTGGDERGVIAKGKSAESLQQALKPMRQEIADYVSSKSGIGEDGAEVALSSLQHTKNDNLVTGAGQITFGTADRSDISEGSESPIIDMLSEADRRAKEMARESAWEAAERSAVDTGSRYVYNTQTGRFVREGTVIGNTIEENRSQWKTNDYEELRRLALEKIDQEGIYERQRQDRGKGKEAGSAGGFADRGRAEARSGAPGATAAAANEGRATVRNAAQPIAEGARAGETVGVSDSAPEYGTLDPDLEAELSAQAEADAEFQVQIQRAGSDFESAFSSLQSPKEHDAELDAIEAEDAAYRAEQESLARKDAGLDSAVEPREHAAELAADIFKQIDGLGLDRSERSRQKRILLRQEKGEMHPKVTELLDRIGTQMTEAMAEGAISLPQQYLFGNEIRGADIPLYLADNVENKDLRSVQMREIGKRGGEVTKNRREARQDRAKSQEQGTLEGFEDTRSETRKAVERERARREETNRNREDRGLSGTPMSLESQDVADQTDLFGSSDVKTQGMPSHVAAKVQPAVSLPGAPDPITPESPVSFTLPNSMEQKGEGKRMSRKDRILRRMGEIAQVPIRVGRFRQKAEGIYKVGSHVVRIKEANKYEVAAHEMAHAIWHRMMPGVLSDPEVKNTYKGKAEKDLERLGHKLYAGKRPQGGYASEGFAEYLRYLTTTDEAGARAPAFHSWFHDVVLAKNRDLADQLIELREMTRDYQQQGALKRVKAHIETGRVGPSVWEKLKGFFSMENWKDEFDSLDKFSRAVEKAQGRKLRTAESPFLTASALKYTHEGRVRQMVNTGMMDLAGNIVGPPLEEIGAIVKGDRENFTAYLYARRAVERWSVGKNPGISKEDAQWVVDKLGSPEFEIAAEKVYDWNRGVLNYVKQCDPGMAPLIAKILGRSEDYVPLARVFDDAELKTGRGRGGSGSPLLRMRGSGRRIRDPFQVMIENASKLLRQAHQRRILRNVLRFADVPGVGKWVEEVPRDMVRQQVKLEDVARALKEQIGEDLDLSEVDLTEMVTFYTPAVRPRGQDPIIPYFDGEKTRWYQVNADLYDSLEGLDIYRLPKALDLLLGVPTRMFKLGTTGFRATFSLARNPVRDLQALVFQTHTKENPLQLGARWVRMNADIWARAFTGRERNAYHDLYVQLGGEMGQSLGRDTRQTRRAVKELFKRKAVKVLSNPIDHMRDFLQIPESATRATELEALAKQVGWTPGEHLTVEQSLDLLLKGKRVTVDFGSAGKFAKVVNQCVPFFNANLQGTRTFLRTFKRNPAGACLKGITAFTIPTLVLWWLNKDKEWYKKLPWRDKFAYWNIEIGDEIIRIPRAYEIGNLFSVLPEALMDSWHLEDPKAVKEAFGHWLETSVPDMVPQSLKPVGEQLQNREWFFDKPIVKRSQQDGPPEEQYGEYTSKLAIWLGKTAKWSPDRIDHLIRGYFGGLGTDLVEMIGLGATARRKKEREPADLPVIGTFFRRGGRRSGRSQVVEDFYREYVAASREYNSADLERKYQPDTVMRYNMLSEASQAIKLVYELMNQEEFLTRDRQAEMRQLIDELAQSALDAVEGE